MASNVRHGDTLIVGVVGSCDAEQAERIKAKLQEKVPGLQVVLITGCSALVVVEGEANG